MLSLLHSFLTRTGRPAGPSRAAVWCGAGLIGIGLASRAQAQLDIPPLVELDWIGIVDAQTWGQEFPRTVARSSSQVFVSGTRVPSAHFILGLEASNGNEVWRIDDGHPIGLQIVASELDNLVFATSYDLSAPAQQRATVQALSASTGALIWESPFTSWSGQVFVQPTNALALSADGTKLFVVGSENEISGSSLLGFATIGCFRTSDGTLEWIQRQAPSGNQLLSYDHLAVAGDGSRVLAAGGDGLGQNGTAYLAAYDTQLGFPIYQSPVSAGRVRDLAVSPGGVQAAIATDPTSFGDDVFVFDIPSGSALWSTRLGDQAVACAYGSDASRLAVHAIQDGILPGTQENQLTTWCLSGSSGQILWSRPFDAPWGAPGGIDEDPGQMLQTLFVEAATERVFAAASRGPEGGPEDFHIASYDFMDGSTEWSQSFAITDAYDDQELRALVGLEGTGQLILVGDDAQLDDPQGLSVRSLDSTDGVEQWQYTWNQSSSAANVPVDLVENASGNQLFLLDRLNLGTYLLVALAAESGEEQWQANLAFPEWTDLDARCQLVPSGDGSAIYVHLAGSTLSRVFAFDATTGLLKWSDEFGALSEPKFTFPVLALAPDDSALFVGADASGPLGGLELRALDPLSGSELWSTDLPSSTSQELFGGMHFDPATRRLFVAGTEAVLIGAPAGADSNLVWYALDGDTGEQVFRGVYQGSPAETPSFEQAMQFVLAPDLQTGSVLGRVDGSTGSLVIATFATDEGKLLWSRVETSPDAGGAEPRDAVHAAAGGVLVVGSRVSSTQSPATDDIVVTGYMTAFGLPLWTRTFDFGAGDLLEQLVTGTDDLTVYGIGTRGLGTALTDELFVFALDALTGESLWTASYDSPLPGFGFDDSGHDLFVDPNEQALFGAGTVWNGEQLADTIVFRFGLPSLYATPPTLSVGAGGTQSLTLRATPEQAGDLFLVVGSATGTSPTIILDGFELPIIPDVYTNFTVASAGSGMFPGSFGLLDVFGRAQAQIQLPPGTNPSLAGVTLNHAYLTFDLNGTNGISFTSNAMPLFLVL